MRMTVLDWILSAIGLAGFLIFLAVIASFVPEADLLIVLAVGAVFAIYDFWVRPLTNRRSPGS